MEPREEIPDFLAEDLAALDDPVLLAVADYAESDGLPPDEVPENVKTSFALQDDETMAAIATYCRKLAEEDDADSGGTDAEDGGAEPDAEGGGAEPDADDESDDDGDPDQASGMFSHGW